MQNIEEKLSKIAPPNTTGVPRIVIPAGIGDAYWVMVKLQAFCKREGIEEKPIIIVLSHERMHDQARMRSIPFLEKIPFIQLSDQKWIPVDPIIPRPRFLQNIYEESIGRFGRTVFPGFMGYEYFISYNGLINSGHYLEKNDDLECNWYLPLRKSDSWIAAERQFAEEYGKYAVFYFSSFTKKVMQQFPPEKIAETICHFTIQTGLAPIFIGAWWDLNWNQLMQIINSIPQAVNMVGKTSLDEAFGIIHGADLVSGFYCGLTSMAIMFRKKTVLLWESGVFPQSTSLAIAPPDTRMMTYIPLFMGDLTIDKYLHTMMSLYTG